MLKLYDDLIFTSKTKNVSELGRELPSQEGKIGVDFVASYDGDNIVYYYVIQSLPQSLNIEFKKIIRRVCKKGVRVNFFTYAKKHKIDWNSAKMRNKLRVLEQVAKENQEKSVTTYNLNRNINDLSRQDWIEESLRYLTVADLQRGRSLARVNMFMTISGKKGADFDESVRMIEEFCKNIGLKLHRILYEVTDAVKAVSPFQLGVDYLENDFIISHVMTDEILARFNTYTHGVIGKRGISFGFDIFSGFPVVKVVKPTGDTAENWLCVAETGGGKSVQIKDKILQLLMLGFNGTIMDIEGYEYVPILKFMERNSRVALINMGEGQGRYFDPVEIFKLTGDEEIDKDAKTMSINFTLSLFKTLVGRAYYEDVLIDTVINDALAWTYKKAGVTEDRSTWGNSKGLTLHDVYNSLIELKEMKYREGTDYANTVDKVVALTSKYFEKDGTRSHLFKERVSVEEIIDADLVVCSFGMAGKSPHSVDEMQLALMQLSAAHLSHQRSIFSKMKGKFNFKVWEEFQRWGNFPDSDKTIGVAVTGGRKLGDVNIIITNDVRKILKDDKFGILSNTTSFIIGSIEDKDVRHELCDRLSIQNMKDILDEITKASELKSSEDNEVSLVSPYKYSFLVGLDRSTYAVARVTLPKDILDSPLFKTGLHKESD